MKKHTEILEEVEKTINSFEAVPKLRDNPYLFTRIKSTIETDQNFAKRKLAFSLKPLIIGLILIVNILTGIFFINADKTFHSSDDTAIQYLKYDYQITQTYNEFTTSN
jgi:hypothetical protein